MRIQWFPIFCALGVSQVQADPSGHLGFLRQAYGVPSEFARITPDEETLIGLYQAPKPVTAGRMVWISVEKTTRLTLAELDALLNPPVPEHKFIEEPCAEGDAAFPFASSHIQDSHLEAVLAQIKETNGQVVVIGHADSVGSDRYNCRLGLKRAQVVASYLVEQGIARDRIAIGSRGKREPLADNRSETGRARNRRASVWIHAAGVGQKEQP